MHLSISTFPTKNPQSNPQPISQVLSERVKVSENTDMITAGVLDEDIADIRQSLHQLADNYSLT